MDENFLTLLLHEHAEKREAKNEPKRIVAGVS